MEVISAKYVQVIVGISKYLHFFVVGHSPLGRPKTGSLVSIWSIEMAK